MRTKKSLSKIVAEKLMYYVNNTNRRCKSGNICRYSGTTLGIKTKGCMIGSFMRPKLRRQIDLDSIRNDESPTVSGLLKDMNYKLPEVIVNNGPLMQSLQNLHDINDNWKKNSLTEYGIMKLENIISNFGLDRNEFTEILKLN